MVRRTRRGLHFGLWRQRGSQGHDPGGRRRAVRGRVASAAAKLRSFATLRYGAKGWNKERCIAARIEATPNGLDIRYVVTSLNGTAKHLYETVYCGRGRCENFIKWHKAQLASDRYLVP